MENIQHSSAFWPLSIHSAVCIFSFKKASLKLSSNRGSPVTHHFEPLCWSLLDISSFGWEVIPLMYLPASCASSLGVISIVYHIVEKKFKSEPSHFTTPSFFPPKYHWLSVVSGNHITLNSFLCGLSAELHDPSHGSYATTLSKLQAVLHQDFTHQCWGLLLISEHQLQTRA